MSKKHMSMNAYLERFNIIKVEVDKQYYKGIVKNFYLKDIDHNEIKEAKIVHDYLDREYHVYELLVDNIRLGHPYQILNNYGLTRYIACRGIVNDPLFDRVYFYDGDDLGASYHKHHTSFKVWSPTSCGMLLKYTLDGKQHVVEMERHDRGVYFVDVLGDLHKATYTYLVYDGQDYQETIDPYAYSSSANGKESVVIAKEYISNSIPNKKLIKKHEMIIYEASIRDYTKKGTYRSFVEPGLKTKNGLSTGIDHIVSLGITHLQFLPIHDFASVEETKPELLYNWGYDPMQFGVPEGSYSSDCYDPLCRVNECVEMVNEVHRRGIYAVMDIVFNHVYDIDTSSFQKLVPYYYFRNDDWMNMSNGSFCSNDINSASLMVRKYLVDMAIRWTKIYGFDGFRFDLMGILDIDTINEIEKRCKEINPSFVVYGEGWDMPTMLANNQKAMSVNQQKMPNISFFNDEFRDLMRGDNQYLGYALGNQSRYEKLVHVLTYQSNWKEPMQSLNYVSCHDNLTLFDFIQEHTDFPLEIRLKQQKMLNAMILLSPGIPFIHGGQEFCRSKLGCENSYNAGDDINHIRWENKETYIEQVGWVKALIAFRKSFSNLKLKDKKEIEKSLRIEKLEHSILVYHLEGEKRVTIIVNPTNESPHYCLEDDQLVFLTSANSIKKEFSSVCIEPLETYIIVEK